MDHAFIASSRLLVGCPLKALTVCCHTHSPRAQGSNVPTANRSLLASSRDALPPWYWLLAQSEAFEGLSGRRFRAGERQLERRERQGRGNAHLQTIDVAFGGQSDPERGGQEVHGQPFALPETSGNNAGQVSTNADTCVCFTNEACVCAWCGGVRCGVIRAPFTCPSYRTLTVKRE